MWNDLDKERQSFNPEHARSDAARASLKPEHKRQQSERGCSDLKLGRSYLNNESYELERECSQSKHDRSRSERVCS